MKSPAQKFRFTPPAAFVSSKSRMPYAAGVDHLLPPAFARLHPKWATPYISILVFGGVASGLLFAVQWGDSLRAAYQAIAD